MKKLILLILFIISSISFGQQLEQNWQFSSVKNQDEIKIIKIDSTDFFHLKDGKFTIQLKENNLLSASGNFIRQQNLLIFNFKIPKDTVRYFNIISLDEANMVLSENDIIFSLNSKDTLKNKEVIAEKIPLNEIKPSQGFSVNSLWRGVLGMFVLIVITFLFSNNKKATYWKKFLISY